jgi:hypothetical protein
MGHNLGDLIGLIHDDESTECEACKKFAQYRLVVSVDGEQFETIPYCSDHVHDAKEHLMDQHNVGTCDWCKGSNLIVKPHRDFEEGNNGPIYDVCKACRVKESDSLKDETGWED